MDSIHIPFNISYKKEIQQKIFEVVTPENEPVRIICWDNKKDNFPIIFTYNGNPVLCHQDGTYTCPENFIPKKLSIIIPDNKNSALKIRLIKLIRDNQLADRITLEDTVLDEIVNLARQHIKDNLLPCWHTAKSGKIFPGDCLVISKQDPDPHICRCAIFDCQYLPIQDLIDLPIENQ